MTKLNDDLGWLSVAAAEAVFFDILVQYWAGDVIPKPAMCTSILLLTAKWVTDALWLQTRFS